MFNSDRRAILIILIIIIVSNIVMYFISNDADEDAPTPTASQSQPEAKPKTTEPKLFYFDPNTADSAQFVSLGLKPRVARNIIAYRRAGGQFRKPSDLARIYTLTDSDYLRLQPYIRIKPRNDQASQTHRTQQTEGKQSKPQSSDRKTYNYKDSYNYSYNDSRTYYPSHKLRAGQTIDLNLADTLELTRIPGIGPYYAQKIIRYRNRLGGFVSKSQLNEIQGVPPTTEQWVRISDTTHVKRLNLNTQPFGTLLRHPYLNYDQVASIFNYRKAFGTIHSLQDLSNYPAFAPSDLERLKNYVDF